MHCFEYLQQTILCAADMTVEAAAVSSDGAVKDNIDGYRTVHQCKKWVSEPLMYYSNILTICSQDEVDKWMVDHRLQSNKYISDNN